MLCVLNRTTVTSRLQEAEERAGTGMGSGWMTCVG